VIYPTTPVKGQPLGLNATGTVSIPVKTANYAMTVSWNSVPLFSHNGDTCGDSTFELPLDVGSVTINGLTCPIAADGQMALNVALTLPASVPSGSYVFKLKGTAGISEIYCVQFDFTL